MELVVRARRPLRCTCALMSVCALRRVINLGLGAVVPMIDNFAHMGGFFAGLLLSLAFFARGRAKRAGRIKLSQRQVPSVSLPSLPFRVPPALLAACSGTDDTIWRICGLQSWRVLRWDDAPYGRCCALVGGLASAVYCVLGTTMLFTQVPADQWCPWCNVITCVPLDKVFDWFRESRR